jgi:hypothetical protein
MVYFTPSSGSYIDIHEVYLPRFVDNFYEIPRRTRHTANHSRSLSKRITLKNSALKSLFIHKHLAFLEGGFAMKLRGGGENILILVTFIEKGEVYFKTRISNPETSLPCSFTGRFFETF